MIDFNRTIEILEAQKSYCADINIDAIVAYDMAIKSLKEEVGRKDTINVYLAGKISNNANFKEDFKAGKEYIREIYGKDAVILDPSILPAGLTQKEYMSICISMINCCDELFLLSNYKESPGALVEKAYAEKIGIPVIVIN